VEYSIHPLADLFPMMQGREWENFKADLRQNGLIEPIILFRGQIIDGRNRYRACTELGIPPRFAEWSGYNGSLNTWIWSKNVERRHLTADQRAMMSAMFEDWMERETATILLKKEAGKRGGKEGGRGRRKTLVLKPGQGFREPRTVERLASESKVSRYRMEQAISVAKRNPSIAPKVIAGEVRLKDAVPSKPKAYDPSVELRKVLKLVQAWINGVPAGQRTKCWRELLTEIRGLKY
jgi:hypothetical protein